MQPKYYTRKAKLKTEPQDAWTAVPLNRDNWWFVQLNGTIETAFYHYGISNPPAIYVEEVQYYEKEVPEVHIYVVRPPLEMPEDVEMWLAKKFYIEQELISQARTNSNEHIIYKIEVI